MLGFLLIGANGTQRNRLTRLLSGASLDLIMRGLVIGRGNPFNIAFSSRAARTIIGADLAATNRIISNHRSGNRGQGNTATHWTCRLTVLPAMMLGSRYNTIVFQRRPGNPRHRRRTRRRRTPVHLGIRPGNTARDTRHSIRATHSILLLSTLPRFRGVSAHGYLRRCSRRCTPRSSVAMRHIVRQRRLRNTPTIHLKTAEPLPHRVDAHQAHRHANCRADKPQHKPEHDEQQHRTSPKRQQRAHEFELVIV